MHSDFLEVIQFGLEIVQHISRKISMTQINAHTTTGDNGYGCVQGEHKQVTDMLVLPRFVSLKADNVSYSSVVLDNFLF